MDEMVLKTQQYLNSIYGGNAGYNRIDENGRTGWATIYALTRALQIELGITQTANSFGPTTERLFNQQYPSGIAQQDSNDTTSSRVYAIIQGALWCKGYSTGAAGITEHFYGGTGSAVKSLKEDAGYRSPDSTVTLNVMKALLSMNQYVTLYLQGGSELIRSIQQQLNRKYENYIGLIPCDGLYGREMNKALIIVLQAIEGFSPSEATGNFGEQTKARCPILPDISGNLTVSVVEAATYLLKYSLCCNGYNLSVDHANWNDTFVSIIEEFQRDLKLNVTGTANIDTWMSLLLSKGNPDRACAACDTRFEITDDRALELKAKGYSIVGRYLTGTTFKVLRDDEPQRMIDHGLYFFPIFQESSTNVSYFTPVRGKADANAAVKAARKFRIPEGNIIYFAVDLDATSDQISAYVLPYFKSLYENMDKGYKVGIYGTRNVCTKICNAGYAETCFVSDMSTGYSGNMGFKIPSNWNFDQYAEIDMENGEWAIDKDAYSGKYEPVKKLDSYVYQQPEKPTITSETTISEIIRNIEILEKLYVDWYTPLFEAAPTTVPFLSAKVLAAGITNFLRSEEYDSLLWDLAMFKAIDKDFIAYVKEHNMDLYHYLYQYMKSDSQLISDEKGGLIDLKHLAATTECYFTATPAPDFWAGWGGDLATAMADTDAYVKNNNTGYQEAADIIVGHAAKYSFSYADLCSDADAIEIANLISASTSGTNSFSESLRDYYQSHVQDRCTYYLDDINCLSNLTAVKEAVSDHMSGFLANSILINYLGGNPSAEAVNACCSSFANYIYKEI